ncbi:MAG TPA: lipid II flippase MurJ, partial [Cellulomonadaceae bacterium]|nr:lipid II flippase MurJ [Cellulomonadaceae bacterium]
RLFYAYEDAKTLFWIQCAMAVVVAGGTWTGFAMLPPRLWTVGAGVATAISYLLGAVVASVGLRRRLGGLEEARILRLYARAGVAGAVAVLAGWTIVHVAMTAVPFTPAGLTAFTHAVVLCVVVGLVMTGLYAALLRAMHVRELEDLAAPVLRRLRRVARRGRAA